ncbi:doublesex- and mab-3-related transcription factor 1-like [Halyomorpha halys]|uniref:doublesex- and mab-3-related transcription factor 1-like n=1 Tax=Halyomorpha halys TaxID=286706 RepID=UPI0006D51149
MSIGRMNEHLRKDEEAIKVKYCAKCKNHGRKEVMKGHKRECARRDCSCDKCLGTEKKRAKTRIQVQLRRIKLEKAALALVKGQDPNRKISEDTLLENATERVRETESFAQEQSNLKRKGEPLIEESSSPWKKTRLDKKPKRTWEAVLALCEDFKFHQDCYPLLHLILKDFTIEEARDKIEQGKRDCD